MGSVGWKGLVTLSWSVLTTGLTCGSAVAQFSFNFGPSGTVVPSVANTSCAGGVGALGGMGAGGICDGTPFLQQLVTIGGNQYYHVVVGDGTGTFGIESYIRTAPGPVCWYGCPAARVPLGGGMMGATGPAPLSSSAGTATNDSAPLASANSGTGRPDRVATRMFVNDAEMSQEFLKATELMKPRITQTVTSAEMTLDFSIDMSNIGYNDMSQAGTVTLRQTINAPEFPPQQTHPVTGDPLPNAGNFDIDALASTANRVISGGRYTYSPGAGDGGSLGAYTYFADGFDIYNVDWASFCDPLQNPASGCVNYGGVRGGGMGGAMMGGAMGGGAMMGGTGGGATMGGAGGGTTSGGGMSGGIVTTTTVAATTTTTQIGGSTGGGMSGGGASGGLTTSTSTSTRSSTTTSTTRTGSTGGGMGGGL